MSWNKISDLSTLKESYQTAAKKEVEILKKLDHPNIIKYMTSFIEDDWLYIIQEYAKNGDLQKVIKHQKEKEKKRFKETLLWSIFYELLLGIDHIHQNNVIHRDLKPLNIFMSATQTVKIGDLGVGKIINDDNKENVLANISQEKVGTPMYFAPELVLNHSYDFKVDIWAIGVIMYYLTALSPPFIGENSKELNANILDSTPKSLPKYYTK